jgi:hypothetical protein
MMIDKSIKDFTCVPNHSFPPQQKKYKQQNVSVLDRMEREFKEFCTNKRIIYNPKELKLKRSSKTSARSNSSHVTTEFFETMDDTDKLWEEPRQKSICEVLQHYSYHPQKVGNVTKKTKKNGDEDLDTLIDQINRNDAANERKLSVQQRQAKMLQNMQDIAKKRELERLSAKQFETKTSNNQSLNNPPIITNNITNDESKKRKNKGKARNNGNSNQARNKKRKLNRKGAESKKSSSYDDDFDDDNDDDSISTITTGASNCDDRDLNFNDNDGDLPRLSDEKNGAVNSITTTLSNNLSGKNNDKNKANNKTSKLKNSSTLVDDTNNNSSTEQNSSNKPPNSYNHGAKKDLKFQNPYIQKDTMYDKNFFSDKKSNEKNNQNDNRMEEDHINYYNTHQEQYHGCNDSDRSFYHGSAGKNSSSFQNKANNQTRHYSSHQQNDLSARYNDQNNYDYNNNHHPPTYRNNDDYYYEDRHRRNATSYYQYDDHNNYTSRQRPQSYEEDRRVISSNDNYILHHQHSQQNDYSYQSDSNNNSHDDGRRYDDYHYVNNKRFHSSNNNREYSSPNRHIMSRDDLYRSEMRRERESYYHNTGRPLLLTHGDSIYSSARREQQPFNNAVTSYIETSNTTTRYYSPQISISKVQSVILKSKLEQALENNATNKILSELLQISYRQ